MAGIFISYRREDSAPYAGRLHDRLVKDFPEDHVFIDIDAINPGEDFVEVINEKLKACDVVLALIGDKWVSCVDEREARRLDNPDDYVRRELGVALARKARIIPVLGKGAKMPAPNELPNELVSLSRRNAVEIRDTRFHPDVDRLVEALRKQLGKRRPPHESPTKEESERQYQQGRAFLAINNYPEAAQWFRQSAEQGHAEAQYSLGVMYAKGRGLPGNHAEGDQRQLKLPGNDN